MHVCVQPDTNAGRGLQEGQVSSPQAAIPWPVFTPEGPLLLVAGRIPDQEEPSCPGILLAKVGTFQPVPWDRSSQPQFTTKAVPANLI